jgi:glycosyltransferase involved in cell wall biosynthesis
MYERIAFGSPSAAAAYSSLPFVGRIEQRTYLELPARPDVPPALEWAPRSVAFVGALTPRKGIPTLLEAWALVEQACPDAELHVIGSGPLERDVVAWASAEPSTRHFHSQLPQRDVLKLLPSFSVLAAPSTRSGRWREQIGLPIKEALRSGLTVVTTSETGLAPWLAAHGHHVVSSSATPEELSTALLQAVEHPLPRARVIADLPDRSVRHEADEWLHASTA